MATERKKVGILFSYSEGWIGGSYYFINLVHALNKLDDSRKPHLVIVSEREEALKIMQATGYQYCSYLTSQFHYFYAERAINKIARVLTKKDIIQKTFRSGEIDVLFGYYEQLFRFVKCRKIYWIPDLQDKYYPQYLDANVVEARKK